MFFCFIKKNRVCVCVCVTFTCLGFFKLHIFNCGNSFIIPTIIHVISVQILELGLKMVLHFIFMALLRTVTKTVGFLGANFCIALAQLALAK